MTRKIKELGRWLHLEKCLLHQHEDLIWDLQYPCTKEAMVTCVWRWGEKLRNETKTHMVFWPFFQPLVSISSALFSVSSTSQGGLDSICYINDAHTIGMPSCARHCCGKLRPLVLFAGTHNCKVSLKMGSTDAPLTLQGIDFMSDTFRHFAYSFNLLAQFHEVCLSHTVNEVMRHRQVMSIRNWK